MVTTAPQREKETNLSFKETPQIKMRATVVTAAPSKAARPKLPQTERKQYIEPVPMPKIKEQKTKPKTEAIPEK